ncbi:MAG TPA: hypothetical protein GXZ91_07530 [Christensenellaceae bacterium]|jgi:5-bromo-4-chloroindolyl phosphate hydrolysis protein|nr:hypothetical protein [Christensenellaceae bacterium]
MNNNIAMILLIFGLIVIIPTTIVAIVISTVRRNRNKKKKLYSGITKGRIDRIQHKGLDCPDIVYVSYNVNGVEYSIKETLKLKSEAIKLGGIPIGQRKTYKLGKISEGDYVTVQYDEANPQNAIITDNDGIINA